MPVRALRRRCCRALQEQAASRIRAGCDRGADERGWARAPPGQDARRLLQGRQAPGPARAHLLYLPRVCLPSAGGPQEGRRSVVYGVPAGHQPRGAEGQEPTAPQAANPSQLRPVARRDGGVVEPHRRRLDELLRSVLPLRAESPPVARQHLLEALGCTEIPTTATPHAVQAVVGRTPTTSPRPVRPLAVGRHRLTAGEKSPVTGDCHAGICGSRGLKRPRPPVQPDVSAPPPTGGAVVTARSGLSSRSASPMRTCAL